MEQITDNDLKEMLTSTININDTDITIPVGVTNDTIEIPDIPSQVEDLNNLEEPDFNTIPSNIEESGRELDPIIAEREALKVGITPEDIKQLYEYVSGKGSKPLFIDKFTSDSDGRLKDMIMIMDLVQLARIPMLTALQSQLQERLFTPENLYAMDISDLTKAQGNITKEIQGILKNSTDAIQTITQFGSLNNRYTKLIDSILVLSEEKLKRIEEIVYMDD